MQMLTFLFMLMQAAFPATVQAVLQSDDNSVLQSGGECLRAYMAGAPDQVAAFMDPATGANGLQLIVSVAGYLLNPAGSEFAATFVGRLVTTLITKVDSFLILFSCGIFNVKGSV
jgi:hypothetical protein